MKSTVTILLVSAGVLAVYNYRQKKRAPKVFTVKKLPGNYTALTIPPFGIFVQKAQADNEKLMEHEHVHWEQYQREGLYRYVTGYFKENKLNGYDLNRYEIEAREKTGEKTECIKDYTRCVRSGEAVTVHNPTFRT